MVSCAAAAVMAHAKARFCSRIAVFLRRRAAKACGGVRLRSGPAASRRTPGRGSRSTGIGQPFHHTRTDALPRAESTRTARRARTAVLTRAFIAPIRDAFGAPALDGLLQN